MHKVLCTAGFVAAPSAEATYDEHTIIATQGWQARKYEQYNEWCQQGPKEL